MLPRADEKKKDFKTLELKPELLIEIKKLIICRLSIKKCTGAIDDLALMAGLHPLQEPQDDAENEEARFRQNKLKKEYDEARNNACAVLRDALSDGDESAIVTTDNMLDPNKLWTSIVAYIKSQPKPTPRDIMSAAIKTFAEGKAMTPMMHMRYQRECFKMLADIDRPVPEKEQVETMIDSLPDAKDARAEDVVAVVNTKQYFRDDYKMRDDITVATFLVDYQERTRNVDIRRAMPHELVAKMEVTGESEDENEDPPRCSKCQQLLPDDEDSDEEDELSSDDDGSNDDSEMSDYENDNRKEDKWHKQLLQVLRMVKFLMKEMPQSTKSRKEKVGRRDRLNYLY